ncbi:MAG TPA: hypothetical protein VMI53_06680, partial [Opitutaceae bacterium]|nr:hypothetical protein [Opitutaceae bacterium]
DGDNGPTPGSELINTVNVDVGLENAASDLQSTLGGMGTYVSGDEALQLAGNLVSSGGTSWGVSGSVVQHSGGGGAGGTDYFTTESSGGVNPSFGGDNTHDKKITVTVFPTLVQNRQGKMVPLSSVGNNFADAGVGPWSTNDETPSSTNNETLSPITYDPGPPQSWNGVLAQNAAAYAQGQLTQSSNQSQNDLDRLLKYGGDAFKGLAGLSHVVGVAVDAEVLIWVAPEGIGVLNDTTTAAYSYSTSYGSSALNYATSRVIAGSTTAYIWACSPGGQQVINNTRDLFQGYLSPGTPPLSTAGALGSTIGTVQKVYKTVSQ